MTARLHALRSNVPPISVRNILFGVVVGLTLLATVAVLILEGWTLL